MDRSSDTTNQNPAEVLRAIADTSEFKAALDVETFKRSIRQATRGIESATEAFKVLTQITNHMIGRAVVLRLLPRPYGWPLRGPGGCTKRLGRAAHRSLLRQRTRAAWQAWKAPE